MSDGAPLLGRCSRCPAIVTLFLRVGELALCAACAKKYDDENRRKK